MARSNYIHITKAEVEELMATGTVEIQIGKSTRRLSSKTAYEIKREKLEADFAAKLAKLESNDEEPQTTPVEEPLASGTE